MIVVDTSVWVAHFRNETANPKVAQLRGLADPNDIIVGDLVLLECLQGARDEAHAARVEAALRTFKVEAMLGESRAVAAAGHYRTLRACGVTPRKTIDVIIASFCVGNAYHLLHQDLDFEPMAAHLGLLVL